MSEFRNNPYLAFDFGAQSGRAVLAYLQSGMLTTEEVHRFANEPVEYGGSLHWDMPRLWFEVRNALSRLGDISLAGIGVDAWGVDYALLGEHGELLQNPYHYRDRRTEGIMEEVLSRVNKEEIYKATGIQFMPINTLYQLFAAHRQTPKLLESAKYLLTIPDLFNYWLTGNAVCEFTNATEELRAKLADFYAQRTLTKRPIFPQDCAAAILWLAGEQCAKTTGHIIPVDGGLPEAFLR